MFEGERYRQFKHSCYDCYKKLYIHDKDKYDRHVERYNKKKNKLGENANKMKK